MNDAKAQNEDQNYTIENIQDQNNLNSISQLKQFESSQQIQPSQFEQPIVISQYQPEHGSETKIDEGKAKIQTGINIQGLTNIGNIQNQIINSELQFAKEQQNNTLKKSNGKGKIKLDYGFKALLRGLRLCLKQAMHGSGLFQGRHHFSDEKLYDKTKELMIKKLGFDEKNMSQRTIYIVLLLLNPAKGIQTQKEKLQGHPQFFQDEIIVELWPFIQANLEYKQCFKDKTPKPNMKLTYQQITKILTSQFNLIPPNWWLDLFS
ncbi:UNKNOWN [Stylonychia lemnae]|uniref:Uncharacterized protein n=1 Tax=Stylonychia lemnae TaxID=5949 RepID=A0A078ABD1_STYLE|nr:UNKNOWN [Stylonychia lemnae]|eukprot:CDW79474.1 UNKNOWN [Stylonychia lemnae]